MVEKKRQQRSSDKNRGTKQRRKKMSYRKKVVAFQIGAITLAIFLLLMVGAVILTKVFVGEANNSQTASADVAGDQVGRGKSN